MPSVRSRTTATPGFSPYNNATPMPTNRTSAGNQFAYEPPQFTLTPDAQRALADLAKQHNLRSLEARYQDAQDAITNSAGEVNDRLTTKLAASKKHAARQRQQQAGSQDAAPSQAAAELETELEQMREKVEKMTKRMEEGMRKLIDGQHSVQAMRQTATTAAEDARASASTQASTLAARSQVPRRTRAGAEGDEDEEGVDFTPTDPDGGPTQAVESVKDAWTKKLDAEQGAYSAFSLRQRYAQDNNYRNFKGIVHNARYPEGDVDLPHESTWFDEHGAVNASGAGEGSDDDEDIQVARASINTTCPITTAPIKEPWTSKTCRHTFEGAAIKQIISTSGRTVGGQPGRGGRTVGGVQAVQCPVAGCDKMITVEDLYQDIVLARHIKRLQDAQRLEDEDDSDEDEGERRRGERIDILSSDMPDVDDYDEEPMQSMQSMKRERMSTAPSTSRSRRM